MTERAAKQESHKTHPHAFPGYHGHYILKRGRNSDYRSYQSHSKKRASLLCVACVRSEGCRGGEPSVCMGGGDQSKRAKRCPPRARDCRGPGRVWNGAGGNGSKNGVTLVLYTSKGKNGIGTRPADNIRRRNRRRNDETEDKPET